MRQFLIVKIASTLNARGWTQEKSARYLGVSQPRVSDLVRGKSEKFTIDTLMQWLFALGCDVRVSVDQSDDASAKSSASSHETIKYLTKAITLNPTNVGLFMNRGDAYFELKQFDLAVSDFTRAIELDPDSPGPRNQRALAYRASGQLKAALLESTAMIKFWPNYSGGYAQRAATYVLLEEYDKAIRDFSKDIELEPERPGAYWNRALIYEQLGKHKKAATDYEHVIKLHPKPDFAQKRLNAVKKKL